MVKANELVTYFESIQDVAANRIGKVIQDKLFKDYPDRLRALAEEALLKPDELLQMKKDEDRFNWIKRHYTNSRQSKEKFSNLKKYFSFKEPMENMETTESISTLLSLIDAIRSRKSHFEDISKNDKIPNAEATANHYKNLVNEDFLQYKKTMESHIDNYNSLFTYVKSLKIMADGKRNELNKLNNKIDTYVQNFNIDGRRDEYEDKNYNFYYTIHFYVLILYFSIIIIYFIFSDYFKEKKFKNKYTNILIILYILLPFFLKKILAIIYNFYIYILEKYNLLDDNIISYPYIIEDKFL